jgi:hypothetical protein
VRGRSFSLISMLPPRVTGADDFSPMTTGSPSTAPVRIAPNENADEVEGRPPIAMDWRTASFAPPGVMDFQSAEMVLMRLSSFSDQALRLAAPRAREILR